MLSRPPLGASLGSPVASWMTTRSPAFVLRLQQGVVSPAKDRRQLLARLAFGDTEAHGELGEPADRDCGVELGRTVLSARVASIDEQSGKAIANSSPP